MANLISTECPYKRLIHIFENARLSLKRCNLYIFIHKEVSILILLLLFGPVRFWLDAENKNKKNYED